MCVWASAIVICACVTCVYVDGSLKMKSGEREKIPFPLGLLFEFVTAVVSIGKLIKIAIMLSLYTRGYSIHIYAYRTQDKRSKQLRRAKKDFQRKIEHFIQFRSITTQKFTSHTNAIYFILLFFSSVPTITIYKSCFFLLLPPPPLLHIIHV